MRDVFHDELDDIGAGVAEMIRLVANAMESATGALLDADLARAERVIEADVRVDADTLPRMCSMCAATVRRARNSPRPISQFE